MPCVQVGGLGTPCRERGDHPVLQIGGTVNEVWNGNRWSRWIKRDDQSLSPCVCHWRTFASSLPVFYSLTFSLPRVSHPLIVPYLLQWCRHASIFLPCRSIWIFLCQTLLFLFRLPHYLLLSPSSVPFCVIQKDMCGITSRRAWYLECVCQRGVSLVWHTAVKHSHTHTCNLPLGPG